MRLIRDLPEAEAAIVEAKISLTNAAMLQTFLRSERLKRRKIYTAEEKRTLLGGLDGKSSRECERSLAAISPQAMPRERERVLSETETEIRFVANGRVQRMLKRLAEVTAHSVKTGGYAALIEKSLEIALKVLDPMEKAAAGQRVGGAERGEGGGREAKPARDESAAPAQKLADSPLVPRLSGGSRYIPRPVYRAVWRRDQGRCTYHAPVTKRRCESRFGLEIDHVHPVSLGGATGLSNLRLLCKVHNQFHAIRQFGARKMETFVPGIRPSASLVVGRSNCPDEKGHLPSD